MKKLLFIFPLLFFTSIVSGQISKGFYISGNLMKYDGFEGYYFNHKNALTFFNGLDIGYQTSPKLNFYSGFSRRKMKESTWGFSDDAAVSVLDVYLGTEVFIGSKNRLFFSISVEAFHERLNQKGTVETDSGVNNYHEKTNRNGAALKGRLIFRCTDKIWISASHKGKLYLNKAKYLKTSSEPLSDLSVRYWF